MMTGAGAGCMATGTYTTEGGGDGATGALGGMGPGGGMKLGGGKMLAGGGS